MEVVATAAAAIAPASVAGGHEGQNNFQRFMAHHPLAFRAGGDPMVADHGFRRVERILEAMEITSDATRIKLAMFKPEGES